MNLSVYIRFRAGLEVLQLPQVSSERPHLRAISLGQMQTLFPFDEESIYAATQSALAMQCIKATIVPNESIG